MVVLLQTPDDMFGSARFFRAVTTEFLVRSRIAAGLCGARWEQQSSSLVKTSGFSPYSIDLQSC